jgi:GNAT superfamily N-acetyltransferase
MRKYSPLYHARAKRGSFAGVNPPDAVILRRATQADAPVIARQRAAMFRDMGELPDLLHEPLVAASEALLRRMIPTEEYVGWLAAPAGRLEEIVGGAGVQVRTLLPRPMPDRSTVRTGPEAIVLNVYTERAWRRRGVARALMDEVIRWVRSRGIGRLVLHASADGRPLYAQLGFEPTNEMMFKGEL